MDEKEKMYWSIMDACIDIEDGEQNHVTAADSILALIENYIIAEKLKEQRPS